MAATNHSDVQRVISKCRDSGCLLLVFVYDDGSYDELNTVWNSEEVTSVINAYKCEKLELSSGSMECNNFTELYPVLVTPSIFIISNDGIPLDMLYGNITAKELTRKINKAIEAHKNGKTNLVVKQQQKRQPLTQNKSNTTVRTAPPIVNHRRTVQRDKINNSGKQQQTTSNSTMATTNTSTDRVVQRRVHHNDSKPQMTAKQVTSCTKCRLQLKVVNSDRKLIRQFNASDTLSVVKECASQELGIPLDAMILEKSYPAYRFVAEDDVKSLSELQLTPTAIVIVKQHTTTSWSYLMLSRAFEILFYMISLIMWPLKWLGSFVSGSSLTSSSSTSQSSDRQQQGKWRERSWQTRRTGNITSFKQSDDDDDDQNTYNGNSTQQQ